MQVQGHDQIVGPANAPQPGHSDEEPGHFDPGGRHWERPSEQRATEARMLPQMLLGFELGHGDQFFAASRKVREDQELAATLARPYARSGSAHAVIVRYLERAATASTIEEMRRLLPVAGAYQAGPANRLQTKTIANWRRGARVVACRGARRCIECDARNIRYRDGYCGLHRPKDVKQLKQDEYQTREVLRAVAKQMGLSTYDREARRARSG